VLGAVAAGYAPLRKTIDIAGGETQKLSFELVPGEAALGHLALHCALPSAAIWIDGTESGRTPLPAELASTSDEHLRSIGLSRQKSSYLKDLGSRVALGELPIETLHELSDEEIISALTQVKGIGRWTAQMFLMFRLGRPDVLPDLDLGVQKGIQKAYRLRKLPTPDRVKQIGAKWAPYRTVGSWYMWRLLDAPKPVPRSGG